MFNVSGHAKTVAIIEAMTAFDKFIDDDNALDWQFGELREEEEIEEDDDDRRTVSQG